MANIARFSAFDSALDDLVNGFFVRPLSVAPAAPVQPRVDIAENDSGYEVRAEIPGVRKEDINVAIDGNQVEITADVKNAKEVRDGERVLRSERYYGKLHRAFALGHDIDESATRARYADGILELTLPKKATAAARRIAIQ
jgi:HSP20 family protein